MVRTMRAEMARTMRAVELRTRRAENNYSKRGDNDESRGGENEGESCQEEERWKETECAAKGKLASGNGLPSGNTVEDRHGVNYVLSIPLPVNSKTSIPIQPCKQNQFQFQIINSNSDFFYSRLHKIQIQFILTQFYLYLN